MEFTVLGPIAARHDGRDLPLGGPKQRALLAILLLRANEVVSRDRLMDGLWGDAPPPTAAHTLDNYVSRLRKLLGPGRLARRAPGYVLHVEPGELDLHQFEELLVRGREELEEGNAGQAAETLRSALALWRGPALADLLYEPFAHEATERLEDKRLTVLEERIEADLEQGRSAELVTELEGLVREHPFRERLHGQLMRAQYRAGRQAEALAAFQRTRQQLADELGLEPSPELRELQQKILEHDPSLESARPQAPRPRGIRSRLFLAGVAAAALVVSAAVAIGLNSGGSSEPGTRTGSSAVVMLSPGSAESPRGVPITGAPASMAIGYGSLWLADPSGATVWRLDLSTGDVVDRIPVPVTPAALAVGGGSVWISGVPGESVTRIDPKTGKVTETMPLGGARAGALAFGHGGLWVADITDDTLIRYDPDSGDARRTLPLHEQPTALAIGESEIWVADYEAGTVTQVDLRTGNEVLGVPVGNGPTALVVGLGGIWVANSLDATVSRIDPSAGAVVATIPVRSDAGAMAIADGSVWVANQSSRTVSRIDPSSNKVVETRSVSGNPTALAVSGGKVWVGVGPRAEHRGGTLVLLHTGSISIDPALQLDLFPLQSDGLTRDGLVTYNHVPGAAGIQLVPDLALSLPTVTDGGRTFTFRLRPGIRYSNGRLVHAADFRRAIERVFRLSSPGRDLFVNIAGAEACLEAGAGSCDLSRGIVTDERLRTVTFHLRASDPGFLANLTVGGLATPVPPGTPLRDTGFKPIPGTGPYKIASATRHEIRYVRNPFFREWSHAAQPDGNPDQIVMRFGLSPQEEVRAIRQGRADWMADNVPARLLPVLGREFAAQLHTDTTTETDFFQFNTTLAPFNDVRVRRALNLAIDRRAIVRIYGGREVATPTCQVLPPGVPGYHRYCPYGRGAGSGGIWTGPHLGRARRLVAASGTRGSRVTVWGWTDDATISPRIVRFAADALRKLGYRVRVRLVPHSFFENPPAGVYRTIQLIPSGWIDTSAYGFFAPWFSCGGAFTHGWFCDRNLNREMRRALSLEATDPRRAHSMWAKVDRQVVDQAAGVPLVNPRIVDFVSARASNYQFHPYWGVIVDQLWVQ